MRTTLGDLLQKDGPVLADGAMGTMLFSLGLQHGDAPESWNLAESDKVKQVHRGYIEAGSQIILTNTFGGNGLRLALHNLSDQVVPLNKAAAVNAVAINADGSRLASAGWDSRMMLRALGFFCISKSTSRIFGIK